MIFVDSIEKDIVFEKYFQTFLLDNLKDRGKKILLSFSSNLETKAKIDWLKDFLNGDTKIIICIDVIEMKVDIQDIRHVIKEEIVDHLIFTMIFEQIGHMMQKIEI